MARAMPAQPWATPLDDNAVTGKFPNYPFPFSYCISVSLFRFPSIRIPVYATATMLPAHK